MDAIIREINRAYVSIEKGEKEGFDGYVFAEDHIHSVLNTMANKDVSQSLEEAVFDDRFVLFPSTRRLRMESSVMSVKMIFSQYWMDVM